MTLSANFISRQNPFSTSKAVARFPLR